MAIERRADCVVWHGGPVPRGADGITLGKLVVVRRGRLTDYLLRHELVHVRQWHRHGALGFLARYTGPYLAARLRGRTHRSAYLRIPFEIEADWVARRQIATGTTLDPSDGCHDGAPSPTRP